MARGGARPGAGRKAGKSANTSPLSRRARARARVEAGNQRPWPADKVERWSIDRLIPYAKNARTHTDAQVAAIAASIKEWGWTTPALVGEDGMVEEERRGVFLDYNQNAKDRTVASAWSVRPTPDARVSMPLEWDEVADCDPAAFTLSTAPTRFAERGDASAGIDSAAESLDALLELSASQEAAGLGDAPWPPHYKKQRDEPPRVAPSRRKASGPSTERRGHRESTQPLITVAKAARKADALAGLERWKARYPEAAARLHVDDVLVDSMRGRSTNWTRIRINLRNVPEGERPPEDPPEPDYDPWPAAAHG